MSEQKQLSKARQALVDRVLSRLDAGAMPWDNGMSVAAAVMPYNMTSNTRYRGMNALNLILTAYERGIADPRWLTFNQAKDRGYSVKKGAKGVPVELYKTIDKRTGKDADFAAIKEEVKDMTFEERQEFKKNNLQSFARCYYVFNATDVDGIEPYQAPALTQADISARNERIEQAIANSEAPIFYDGHGRNYYNSMSDEIHLTAREAFKSDEFFYNTALHEMAHSTGHGSRLNRNMGDWFGSKSYAREELVAEISSVLTAAEFGLNHSDRVMENSAEYVRSWAKLIRENPQTLIDATFDASRATDYICDMEQRQKIYNAESEQPKEPQGSPMYRRYMAVQTKYPNAIVVWRLGDFYEVMGENARVAANALDLTLTGRDVGLDERVPMCGFPYHAADRYIAKLIENHAVAVVENDGREKYTSSKKEEPKTPLENLAAEEKTQKERLQSNVREWYSRTYPTDELAETLDDKATFGSVRDALRDGKDVYTVLGSADSVVRERVFKGLSEVLDVPYKAVYDAWANGGNQANGAWVAEKDGKNVVIGTWETHDISEKREAPKTAAAPKPTFKTKLDNIPEAMKALPNWVAFRTEVLPDGKVKKILLSPNKGANDVKYLKWAKANDPSTWSTFGKAAAFAKKYKLEGLAFAMSGSGMTCIDLDHHLDADGKPSEFARKFIDAAQGTYIERSVSGRGLHIFYAGERPKDRLNRNDDVNLEIYDSARFMSMTGNIYDGAPKAVTVPSAELTNLLKSNLGIFQTYSAPNTPLGVSDSELIGWIERSKVGGDFSALWHGEDICGNHSVSDMKLCNMLAFFSGGDAVQVERCFRSSGLYRPEKGDAYVKRTAEKACATLQKAYAPPSSRRGSGSSGR